MHPIDHIRQFAKLAPEVERRLRAMMRQERFPKGYIIQGSQTLSANAFYIVSGAARLFYTHRGREHTISFAFSDQFALVPRNISRRYGDTLAVQFLEPSTLIFLSLIHI